MEINEKKHKKEQQELIIRKYQQYLKLEKSLSLNTLDAYLTDLDKLMSLDRKSTRLNSSHIL